MCAAEAGTELIEALLAVHRVLDDAGIEHALCGGIAANLYRDEMRTTIDVDLYVISGASQVVGLSRTFEKKGWRAHPAWRKAELLRLERDDLPRVDVLIASTDFERQAVTRAVPASIVDQQVPVLLPEDLIVFKLVAGRLRDYEAAAAIINSQGNDIDRKFIRRVLIGFGMEDRWSRVIEEAAREAEDDS